MTPVSDTVSDALSHGNLGFALHGSYLNHFLIGRNSSTANQILRNKWLLKLPWKAKPRVPCERAQNALSEIDVKSDPEFCLGPSIEKQTVFWLLTDCVDCGPEIMIQVSFRKK